MPRYGPMYGPDVTFLGVPPCDLGDPASFADVGGGDRRRAVRRRDHAPAGRPVRPAGDPAAPTTWRTTAPGRTWRCAWIRCRTCACPTPATWRCRRATSSGRWTRCGRRCPRWPRPAPSRWSSAATTRSRCRTCRAWPSTSAGAGSRSCTSTRTPTPAGTQWGSLYGHGTPMRRLVESGAVRGDRFLQIGLRGYWPGPETLAWMAEQGFRSYEMTEVVARGLDECLTEAFAIATDDCDGVFLSIDVDVVDPGMAPGTGYARAGRADRPAAARRGPPVRAGAAGGRAGRGRGGARRTTRRRSPRSWPTGSCWRRCPASPPARELSRADSG